MLAHKHETLYNTFMLNSSANAQSNMQNATYTQAQQDAFVAKLQHTQVHAITVQHGLMLAYTDMGCAYSMGGDVWEATGEAQQGEVSLREEFVCEYSTDETTLYLHFEDEDFTKRYTNDEEGWAQAARDSLECNDL